LDIYWRVDEQGKVYGVKSDDMQTLMKRVGLADASKMCGHRLIVDYAAVKELKELCPIITQSKSSTEEW